MVESVTCYGCEVWFLKTEEQRKLIALEMDYLMRSDRMSRLVKNPKPHHQEQNASRTPISDRIQRGNLNSMDSLDGKRKFTSGHRTVGGEEEDRNNNGRTKQKRFASVRRKVGGEEEDRNNNGRTK